MAVNQAHLEQKYQFETHSSQNDCQGFSICIWVPLFSVLCGENTVEPFCNRTTFDFLLVEKQLAPTCEDTFWNWNCAETVRHQRILLWTQKPSQRSKISFHISSHEAVPVVPYFVSKNYTKYKSRSQPFAKNLECLMNDSVIQSDRHFFSFFSVTTMVNFTQNAWSWFSHVGLLKKSGSFTYNLPYCLRITMGPSQKRTEGVRSMGRKP